MKINTWGWRKLRDQIVKQQPLCQIRLPGCTGLSETADHIIPRWQRPDLTMTPANLRGACHHCNRQRNYKPDTPTTPPALSLFNVPPPPSCHD